MTLFFVFTFLNALGGAEFENCSNQLLTNPKEIESEYDSENGEGEREQTLIRIVIWLYENHSIDVRQLEEISENPNELMSILETESVRLSPFLTVLNEVFSGDLDLSLVTRKLKVYRETLREFKSQKVKDQSRTSRVLGLRELRPREFFGVESNMVIVNLGGKNAVLGISSDHALSNNEVTVFNPIEGKVLKKIVFPEFVLISVIYDSIETEYGSLVALGALKGMDKHFLLIVEVNSGKILYRIPLPSMGRTFRFIRENERILLYGLIRNESGLTFVDLGSDPVLNFYDLGGSPIITRSHDIDSMFFQKEGERFLALTFESGPENIQVFSLDQRKVISRGVIPKRIRNAPFAISLSSGKYLVFAFDSSDAMYVMEPFLLERMKKVSSEHWFYSARNPVLMDFEQEEGLAWGVRGGVVFIPMADVLFKSVSSIGSFTRVKSVINRFLNICGGGWVDRVSPPIYKLVNLGQIAGDLWKFSYGGEEVLVQGVSPGIRNIDKLVLMGAASSEDLPMTVLERLECSIIGPAVRFEEGGSSFLVFSGRRPMDHVRTFQVIREEVAP